MSLSDAYGSLRTFSFEEVATRLAASKRQRIGSNLLSSAQRGMTSLAVTTPGTPHRVGLFGVDRDNLGANLEQPKVKLATARVAQPRFAHDRSFEHCCCRNQANRIIRNPHFELCRVRISRERPQPA